jgi:hypothetical protein
LVVFSPITGEMRELTIDEAVEKWNLRKRFNTNFSLWELNNFISALKVKQSIVNRKIIGPNVDKERRKILGNKKILKQIKNE